MGNVGRSNSGHFIIWQYRPARSLLDQSRPTSPRTFNFIGRFLALKGISQLMIEGLFNRALL